MVILSGGKASEDEGPACDCNKRQMYIPALVAGIYAPSSALCNFHRKIILVLTSFARSPSRLKSSRGFTVESFIERNCENNKSHS